MSHHPLATPLFFCCLVASLYMALASKVAVIGGGISGSNLCSALRKLSGDVCEIDLYDKGRELGGRASTRTHTHHGAKYVFDHGAQYIGRPQGATFTDAINDWLDKGYIEVWSSRLRSWSMAGGMVDVPDDARYTPTGGFSALCRSLIAEARVKARNDVAVRVERTNEHWSVVNTRTQEVVGTGYDQVVFTDRSSVLAHEHVFTTIEQQMFYRSVRSMQQRPLLSLMVVFDALETERLEKTFPHGGCKFIDHPVLGWVAKDSSKGGRGRDDGKSCYVIQSQYTFAEDLIKSVEIDFSGASPDEIRAAVARACEDPLLSAFLGTLGGEVMLETRAMFARGHRWGAAAVKGELPAVAPQLHCYADRASGVVAVGDYLAREGSGKVEGAVVSSLEAARVLASW